MNSAYLYAFSGVLLNTFAQLFLKAGTNQVGAITGNLESLLKVMCTPIFYGGFACYGLSLILWIMALAKLPVSTAYPLLSIGYVINAGLAYWLFNEAITPQKCLGLGFIILGVYLVSRS
jgi:multidrug transporter EmrE-like cation transporter